jgi:C-terminal processing protease CtpA/Prc
MRILSRIALSLFTTCSGISISHSAELPPEQFYSRQQLIEDYDILYSSLVNYHPAPSLYIQEEDLKSYTEKQKSTFPDSLSDLGFHLVARQLIAQIKCGHTLGVPSDSWFKSVKGKELQLPFDIKRIDGKVYVNNTTGEEIELSSGDELLTINDIPISDLLSEMYSMQERDGNTMSHVEEMVIRRFRRYYLYTKGYQSQFVVEYQTKDGALRKTTLKPSNKPIAATEMPALPGNLKVLNQNDWSLFATDSSAQLAYLQIKSFSDRNEYRDYYQVIFKQLEKMPTSTLIIDLRDNTGGFFRNGCEFLTYLTPNKFDLKLQRPKGKFTKNRHATLDKWNKLTKFGFVMKPGGYRAKGYKTTSFGYKPKSLLFSGKVSVLTNGITFSMAALTAAQLHDLGAEFWGTETGGTENGTNCMVNYVLTLPNTGIKVTIPHYRIISNSVKGKFGYGVQPDYEASAGLDASKDNVLQLLIDSKLPK